MYLLTSVLERMGWTCALYLQSLIQADKNLRLKTFLSSTGWTRLFALQQDCFTATSNINQLPLLQPASRIYQIALQLFKLTQSIWMTDWGCPSYFLPCLFVMRKNSKPCCLITGGCNQSERGQNSKSRLREREKKKKRQRINGMETSSETFFILVFKEFFIWRKLKKVN